MAMNLLNNWKWMPILRLANDANKREDVEPWQITESIDTNPIVDVLAPRADFKGALYQFLIGLLQTTFAPEDEDEWRGYWRNPPDGETLKAAFAPYLPAFELNAFMQDFDLSEGEPKDIAALLIEAPGGKTLRDNLDHFIKGGQMQRIAPHWAALALFTLQINAPAGGVGHRVGLRGGGPLTTLVLPPETQGPASLWNKLWLNVMTREEVTNLKSGNAKLKAPADIFPWLAKTRTSEAKTGVETYPENCHPLQMYWAMPRRIRLDLEHTEAGVCSLSGEYHENLVSGFITKNYGVNYVGPWMHPLTPYSVDAKTGPLSIKGQPGGVFYRHWLGLVLESDEQKTNRQPAQIVSAYYTGERQRLMGSVADYTPRLWAFGYDMDNMKARCWYEATLPIFPVEKPRRGDIQAAVQTLLDAANETLGNLRTGVKQAWFSRPKDAKGDFSFVDRDFWQSTEADFYQQLQAIIQETPGSEIEKARRERWRTCLRHQALAIFDYWALSGDNEDGDLKRLVQARAEMERWLNYGKQMKKLAA
jgi:CRISPR system Cascade subunit CasA